MENNDASQVLKKLLKVDRSGSSTPTSTNKSSSRSSNGLLDLSGDMMTQSSGQPHINGGSVNFYGEMLQSLGCSRVKQQITLGGSDVKNSHRVYGQDVEIIASRSSSLSQPSTTGSSKVKINPVVNFDWEARQYFGNLVAVHLNRTHLAYILRGNMVRVYNRKTAERVLLKGFVGSAVDISFAFCSAVVLAIVDEVGGVQVHDISEAPDGKLLTSLRLQINRPSGTPSGDKHLLVWCNYVPDKSEQDDSNADTPDDASMLLMVTHDSTVEVWNVESAAKKQHTYLLSATENADCRLRILDNSHTVTDAMFSPDGVDIAIACLDGYARFYDLNNAQDGQLNNVNQWKPHGGQPITSMFFLDDLKHQDVNKYWSTVVTGTSDNHEFKIWSCQTWQCLQTITIVSPAGTDSSITLPTQMTLHPYLKARLDLSATYLVLSDISRKVLYILQFHQDQEANVAHVCSVSEFLLAQPVLSFAILDAGRRRLVKAPEYAAEQAWTCTTGEIGEDDDEIEAPVDDRSPDIGILVRLYAVHNRAMQELQIRYQPESSAVPLHLGSCSSTSDAESSVRDPLSDLSMFSNFDQNGEHHVENAGHRLSSSSGRHGDLIFSSNQTPTHPVLMAPNAFTSSATRISDDTIGDISAGSVSSSLTLVTAVDDDEAEATMASLHTPHSAPAGQNSLSDIDPLSVLPAEPHDLFPRAKETASVGIGYVATSTTDDNKLLVDLSDNNGSNADRMQRSAEHSHSESSSAELTEILESARQSNGLDINAPSASSAAYNDEDIETDGEEEEDEECEAPETGVDGDGQPGIQQFVEPDWRSIVGVPDRHRYPDHIESGISGQSDESPSGRRQQHAATVAQLPLAGEYPVVTPAVIEDLQHSVQQVVQLLQLQQNEISNLKSLLGQQMQATSAVDRLSSQVETLESNLLSHISDMFQRQAHSDADRWHRAMADFDARSHQLHTNIESLFIQNLNETVRSQMETIIRTEFTASLLPHVAEILDGIKNQLHVELAQKLTATDAALKDSINKLVRSKQTMELLAQTTTTCMQSSMQAVSRDVLLPSFDRACQNMFEQVSATFQKGSQEYIQQMESQIQSAQRRRDEARDPVLNQLRALSETLKRREQLQDPVQERLNGAVEALKVTNTQMVANSGELEARLVKKMNSLNDALVGQLKQIVQQEVSVALRNQQTSLTERLEHALRSGAATPVPSDHAVDNVVQLQQQIATLLRQGKIAAAFQQALSAVNLQLVIFVCGACEPAVIFNETPCPLSQPILLSLIQQLSVHFESDLELKHRYLEEALLKLDQSNPVTREHMSAVINKLLTNLTSYLQTANPKDKMYGQMGRLRSVCEFIVRGCSR